MTREIVRAVQVQLTRWRELAGELAVTAFGFPVDWSATRDQDGIAGPRTKSAVRAFARWYTRAALPTSGDITLDVIAALELTLQPATAVDVDAEDRRFRAHLQGGARSATNVVVIHSTEGPTAQSAATWFHDPRSTGSTHLVIDDDKVFRCVEDDRVAYGAHPFNRDGMHLEIAGFARWSREEWLQHPRRIERAARVIARWCRLYDIPVQFLQRESLLAGPSSRVRGITTHGTIVAACGNKPGSLACGGAGNHWDPGPGFPLELVLDGILAELAKAAPP